MEMSNFEIWRSFLKRVNFWKSYGPQRAKVSLGISCWYFFNRSVVLFTLAKTVFIKSSKKKKKIEKIRLSHIMKILGKCDRISQKISLFQTHAEKVWKRFNVKDLQNSV